MLKNRNETAVFGFIVTQCGVMLFNIRMSNSHPIRTDSETKTTRRQTTESPVFVAVSLLLLNDSISYLSSNAERLYNATDFKSGKYCLFIIRRNPRSYATLKARTCRCVETLNLPRSKHVACSRPELYAQVQ